MAGAAVLLLAGHRSDAPAQTFNDAIQGALDGGGGGACNGLKGAPFQGSLNSICASPYPVPEGRARGYILRDYDVVRRAIYSNPNNGLNAEGSGVNGFVLGDTTGNEFRTSVQTGYEVPLGALTVGSCAGVNYSSNAINSYDERGSFA